MTNLTILIKTFNRPVCLNRLLKSIKKFCSSNLIVIIDDSELDNSHIINKYGELSIKYFKINDIIGVSAGRNMALKEINTKYFFCCDDDFVFDNEIHFEKAINVIEKNNTDILGGYVRNFRAVYSVKDQIIYGVQSFLSTIGLFNGVKGNYIGNIEENNGYLKFNLYTEYFPEFEVVDVTMNSFVARTESILKMGGWNEKVGIGPEHIEFFYRAKKFNLKVAFSNCFSVQHRPIRNMEYRSYREGSSSAEREFMLQHGIKGYSIWKNEIKNAEFEI